MGKVREVLVAYQWVALASVESEGDSDVVVPHAVESQVPQVQEQLPRV